MTTDFLLTKESDLQSNHYIQTIERFWQSGVFGSFAGVGEQRIEYAYFFRDDNIANIVISPGRCEGYLKYQEVAFDLYRNKYNVFIIDHRGQGFSQRALINQHKGYVDNFDFYAQDLHTFIKTIVIPKSIDFPYLLAHSMGCAVAARMFQCFPRIIQNSVLLSPMIAINSGAFPYSLAKMIVSVGNSINKLFLPKNSWYFLGQRNYKATPFEKNILTHSQVRYQKFITLYKGHPKIQLGGVTFQWLAEAIKSEANLFADITKIDTPLIVVQASEDCVVDNNKQNLFCEHLHKNAPNIYNIKPLNVEGSRHELLFESDSIRSQAFQHIFTHFPQSLLTLDHGE